MLCKTFVLVSFQLFTYTKHCIFVMLEGKFVNGTVLVVDGGQWLSTPRLLSKDAVKQLSRREEIRSRAVPTGLPKSKL
ncbi:hypothetical protein QUC31_015944 [Theobroma cacao]